MNFTKKLLCLVICFSALVGVNNLDAQTTYYVAKTGADGNSGTEDSPFLTIQKAATVANAGDVVMVTEGIYRETVIPSKSGSEGNPITYKAKDGDEVVVSGMEVLNGWQTDQGSIKKVQVPFSLGNDNMILYNGVLCDLARYPNNTDADPFTTNANNSSGGSLSEMSGTFPNYDWTDGGFIWYLGNSRWTSWRVPITSSSSDKVGFTAPSSWVGTNHDPANGGLFILVGLQEALDHEYEFFYKPSNLTLFLQTPGGVLPADGEVEMKKRNHGFRIHNKNYIIIDGIDVYGCNIELTGSSSNNIIRNIKSTWGNHTWGEVEEESIIDYYSIFLGGSNNLVEKSEIAWGANSGIRLAGDQNVVHNNIIHDFNYIATYGAPVQVRYGENSKVTQNTIYNGGRDLIQGVNRNSEYAYNNLYNSNIINDDCGPIYVCCGQHYSEIHHNFIHDCDSEGTHYKATGIYLDNSSQYWDVHHNVIMNMEWTGIQQNWDNWYINIYNNTIWNTSESMGSWTPTGTQFIDINVFNNLADDPTWEGTDFSNNLGVETSPFKDIDGNNFQLKENSEAIDYGTVIDGMPAEYMGSSPDAGAFESGAVPWVPGATWITSPFPVSTNDVEIKELNIEIFPNPTIDHFKVDLDDQDAHELYVFDDTGKQVMHSQSVMSGEAIQVQTLSTGIYFVYFLKGNVAKVGRIMKL